jgi:hypothetical protein
MKAALDLESIVTDNPPFQIVAEVCIKNSNLLSVTLVLPDAMSLDCTCLTQCKNLIFLYVETFSTIQNLEKLPRGLVKISFEGRPSLSSQDRQWIARNLLSVQYLRLNLISHPFTFQFDDNHDILARDLGECLRMPKICSLNVTTQAWFKYEDLHESSKGLGFKPNVKFSLDHYQVTLDYSKESPYDI